MFVYISFLLLLFLISFFLFFFPPHLHDLLNAETTGQLLRDSLGNFLDKLTESPQSNQTFLTDAHKLSNNFAPVKLDQKTEIDMLAQNFTDSLPCGM